MTKSEKLEAIQEAWSLVEEAQNLVDGVMQELDGQPKAHYEAYGKYGFSQLLANGNPYDSSLNTIIETIEEQE